MTVKRTPADHAALAATGAAVGAATGLIAKGAVTNLRAPPGANMGAAYPVANFTAAATHALKNHSTLRTAFQAGATAAVGGPAVVATAVAAAPVVLAVAGVAAGAAAVYGLYRWLSDE